MTFVCRGSRAGRARLDTKGLSSFKPVTASLGHGFVLQNWQLSYSVHMTHSEMTFGCQVDAQARPPRQQRSFFVQARNRFAGLRAWFLPLCKVRFAPTFFYSCGTRERHPHAPLLLLPKSQSLTLDCDFVFSGLAVGA